MTPTEAVHVVDKLFERFALRYARVFLTEYEGLDISAVKSEWAEELQRFSIDQCRNAFENCKYAQYPPSLPTFIAHCKAAPFQEAKRIEQTFTEEDLQRNKKKIRQILNDFTAKMQSKAARMQQH